MFKPQLSFLFPNEWKVKCHEDLKAMTFKSSLTMSLDNILKTFGDGNINEIIFDLETLTMPVKQ